MFKQRKLNKQSSFFIKNLIFVVTVFLYLNTLCAQKLTLIDSLIKEEKFRAAINECIKIINLEKGIDSLDLGNVLMRKGKCFFLLENRDSSLSAYFTALSIFEKIKNTRRIAAANSNIADIYHIKGDYQNSKKYYDEAYKNYYELKDPVLLDRNYNDRAVILFKLNDVKEAIGLQHNALTQFASVMTDDMRIRHLMNLGTFFEPTDRDSSLYYYSQAEKNILKLKDTTLLSIVYNNMGVIYKQNGDWQKSALYLQKSAYLTEHFNNKADEIRIYNNLAEVYDTLGLHQKSNHYYKRVVVLSEDVFNKEKDKFSSELAEKYESVKKDERIKAQEIENKLKGRNLILSLVGLVLAALLALFIYFNYRRKQKVNNALKIRNAHIEMLNEDLDTANQVKSKIYALISHDIRAPLSTLEYYLETNKHAASDLNVSAITQIDNVLDTLEDLLIWGKTQMHGFTPTASKVDIGRLVGEQVKGIFSAAIELKKIKVQTTFQDSLLVYTDENILGIILRNILTNALKFAPNSSYIEVTGESHLDKFFLTVTNEIKNNHFKETSLQSPKNITSSSSGLGHLLIQDLSKKINADFFFKICEQKAIASVSIPVS